MNPLAKTTNIKRLGGALQAWIGSHEASTVKGYRNSLEIFSKWWVIEIEESTGAMIGGDPSIGEALEWFCSLSHGEANEKALRFRSWLQKSQKYAPTTVGTHLSALRSFIAAANVVDVVPWTLQIKGPKAEVTRDTRGPAPEGVDAIRQAAKSQVKPKAARDVAIVWLLFNIGLRRFEVGGLNLDSLNGLEIRFKGKKRNAPEVFKLSTECRKYLDDWIKVRGKNEGPLFHNCDRAHKGEGRLTDQGIYNLVVSLAKKAGMKHTTPHMLRHSAATELYNDTHDIVAVQKFLRHKNVATTMRYLDIHKDTQGIFAEKLGELHKEKL